MHKNRVKVNNFFSLGYNISQKYIDKGITVTSGNFLNYFLYKAQYIFIKTKWYTLLRK